MSSVFISDSLTIRNEQEHLDRIRALEMGNRHFYKYFKSHWGIKGRSPLLDIEAVQITKILLHDIQHVLFEGIDHLVLKHSIRHFISQGYFSLEQLNTCIENFDYVHNQLRDKPSPIVQCALESTDNNLRQTAAGMLNLIILFPFIFGFLVPETDEVYKNLILLRKINILALSFVCNDNTRNALKMLIAEHHYNFVRIFPNASFTPKMHYCIHLPEQIVSHGPLRFQWCMRFEAKHGQFKSMKIKNFKNAVRTMCKKHQRWMCAKMHDSFGKPIENFLYRGDEVKQGSTIELISSQFSNVFQMQNVESLILITESIKIHGLDYEFGTVLLRELYSPDGFVLPHFIEIIKIGVYDHEKAFFCELLCVDSYSDHFGAYEVSRTGKNVTIKFFDLKFKFPQLKNRYAGKIYVSLFGVPDIH